MRKVEISEELSELLSETDCLENTEYEIDGEKKLMNQLPPPKEVV
jgi:hypothetical protein